MKDKSEVRENVPFARGTDEAAILGDIYKAREQSRRAEGMPAERSS
jgi:hypothetical protein